MSRTRRYRVVHRTTYRYESPMTDGYTVAHLLPARHASAARRRIGGQRHAGAVGARRARRRVRQPRHPVRRPPPARRARRRSREHGATSTIRSRSTTSSRGTTWPPASIGCGATKQSRSARSGRGHASSISTALAPSWPASRTDRSRRAGGSPRRPTTCATGSSTSSRTTRRRPTSRARWPTCWRRGAACARTSPIWRRGACARSGSPRATSAATSRPTHRRAVIGSSAPTHRMPGARSGHRRRAGSTSIRRTTTFRPAATSPSRGAATTPTSHRSAACVIGPSRAQTLDVAVDVALV